MVCLFVTWALAAAFTPSIELVESAPIETTLDHSDIPNAGDVWKEMVEGAKKTLDFAEFYAISKPGTKLEAVITAVQAAGARGVKVRFLADKIFAAKEKETLDRLAKLKGVELRIYDVKSKMGGILHAKYFIVDGREVYLGSQNFDWKSLEHIQELGVRMRAPAMAASFTDVFETDWQLAGGAADATRTRSGEVKSMKLQSGGGDVDVTPVFSPKGWLPDEKSWDLPRIVQLIDSAKKSVRVQLLTYQAIDKETGYFDDLENALRRAAGKGVAVELMLADWSMRHPAIDGVKSLAALPNVSIKLVTIPEWSGGFLPYARVIHSKYVVVDGERSWIGTSNWERGYFHHSRNVGVMVDGAAFAGQLERVFADGWKTPYAKLVDLGTDYKAPTTH
jgi:phosphatidylserine/phosphatidylglycerophosphate/cardiolipin synthase-like enzyme